MVIFALPSKETPLIVTGVANLVVVLALPDKDPVNTGDDTEVKPAMVVADDPKAIEVDPIVIELFANCAFVMPALLDKLFVVNPVAEIVPELIEIPEPAVNAGCFALNKS